jgi:hypothetical protein
MFDTNFSETHTLRFGRSFSHSWFGAYRPLEREDEKDCSRYLYCGEACSCIVRRGLYSIGVCVFFRILPFFLPQQQPNLERKESEYTVAMQIDGSPPQDHEGVVLQDLQQVRRNSIRDIMADDDLTPIEKRKVIQSLMDGRRRSSDGTRSSSGSVGEMERAAAEAAEHYQSDTEDDNSMIDDPQQRASSNASDNSSDASSGGGDREASSQVDWNAPHQRRKRSSSLPLWSDNNVQAVAPLAAASSNVWDDPMNVNRRMEKSRPPCAHYERNCTLISPCCGLAFGCRICHDDCPVLPLPFSKRPKQNDKAAQVGAWSENMDLKQKQEKRRSLPLGFDEEETHHEIDRFAIQEVICRLCYFRQSSKTYVSIHLRDSIRIEGKDAFAWLGVRTF